MKYDLILISFFRMINHSLNNLKRKEKLKNVQLLQIKQETVKMSKETNEKLKNTSSINSPGKQ